jgi:hypothetical protein
MEVGSHVIRKGQEQEQEHPSSILPCAARKGGGRNNSEELRAIKKTPHRGVSSRSQRRLQSYITSGSLNASISPAKASIGMQLQNTFLSPCTLSTRATGGQYFCSFSVASGNAASSRG